MYELDGSLYLWDRPNLYIESFNKPGHKDGTFNGIGGPGLDPEDCWKPLNEKVWICEYCNKTFQTENNVYFMKINIVNKLIVNVKDVVDTDILLIDVLLINM